MNWESVTRYIGQTAEYGDLLPIAIFLFFPIYISRFRYFFTYLVLFQLLHLTGTYFSLHSTNNMWVYKTIGLVELLLISIYYQRLHRSKLIRWSFSVVAVFYFFYSFFYIEWDQINSLALGVSTLFLITLNLHFFYRLYVSDKIISLGKYLPFWINSALLIYLSSSFFAYLLSSQSLFNTPDLNNFFRYSWVFHSMGNIVKCGVLATGLLICHRSTRLSETEMASAI